MGLMIQIKKSFRAQENVSGFPTLIIILIAEHNPYVIPVSHQQEIQFWLRYFVIAIEFGG